VLVAARGLLQYRDMPAASPPADPCCPPPSPRARRRGRLLALLLLASLPASARVSPEQAARLGRDLTPVGAERSGNAAGTIPAFVGESLYIKPTPADRRVQVELGIRVEGGRLVIPRTLLERWRTERPAQLEEMIKAHLQRHKAELGEVTQPIGTITRANLSRYAGQLSEGHQALFAKYADYRMPLYRSYRDGAFPPEIYAATRGNALAAQLRGTDQLSGARLGFPFPIPGNGPEVMWNHKLKYRGSAVRRYNAQAIVDADGSFRLTRLVEDVKFKYASLKESGSMSLLAYYLLKTVYPPSLAGQQVLVHETASQGAGDRVSWIYDPSKGRVFRAPEVGYDNPTPGTSGEQFNDQIDVFNGTLDRYDWKLAGKKEMFISYHAYALASPVHRYSDLIRPGHLNPDFLRYELHRVWLVDATLKPGLRHRIARRRFYVDEDSWSIAAVDCYDSKGKLWQLQEAHLLPLPFIPTVTGLPEVIHDLQKGRSFVTTLINEEPIFDYDARYDDGDFSPMRLQQR